MALSRPRLAVIAGPTASGKSALALALAEREGGTVINADAAQVYRDLRLLTARPSAEDEARVPHRLFGHRDAALPCSAAEWAADAAAAVEETVAAGRLPVLVGGTGLYLRTLLHGIAAVPAIDAGVRDAVRRLPQTAARAALEEEDSAAAARLHPNDAARTARALEVVRATGRPLAAWQEERRGGLAARFAVEVTLLDPPRAELYARCDRRFDAMLAAGGLAEAAALAARGLDPALPAMRAIGVPELLSHLAAERSLAEAAEAAKRATRNYAKRQRTWFRHQAL